MTHVHLVYFGVMLGRVYLAHPDPITLREMRNEEVRFFCTQVDGTEAIGFLYTEEVVEIAFLTEKRFVIGIVSVPALATFENYDWMVV